MRAQGAQRLITTNVSFTPETKTQKNAADKTVGYTGSTRVSLRTTPEKAPDVLAGALANGANTIDSTVFTPTEQEIDDARRDLAAQATKTAVTQVESIAKAMGLKLVAVRDVSVGSPSPAASEMADRTNAFAGDAGHEGGCAGTAADRDCVRRAAAADQRVHDRRGGALMDASVLKGEELTAVEFVERFLQLRFGDVLVSLYVWPDVADPDGISIAFGEPGYRDALCLLIGETVETAELEVGRALTAEFENGYVLALSLREEDVDTAESGTISGLDGEVLEF